MKVLERPSRTTPVLRGISLSMETGGRDFRIEHNGLETESLARIQSLWRNERDHINATFGHRPQRRLIIGIVPSHHRIMSLPIVPSPLLTTGIDAMTAYIY